MAHALATGSGVVLDLIRSGAATTRTDLIDRLGWSRVTLARRLDELLDAGFIVSAGQLDSRGGRPPEEFAVNRDAGLLLAVDIGGTHTRVGVTDLVSDVLTEAEADIGLASGPDDVFGWARQVFDVLLRELGSTRADVRGIGVGVPGPVDARTGTLGTPHQDPQWAGVRIGDHFGDYDAILVADRDVNVLAVGEARLGWPEYRDITVLKLGIGVGCAFVLDGRVYRGSRGGAGQLTAADAAGGPLRRLELLASGGTIRARLRAAGTEVTTSAEIVALARAGDRLTLTLLDDVAATVGREVATVVSLLNPEAVVVGGNLAEAGDRFLDTIRSTLLDAAEEFARSGVVVEPARLGNKAGVRGASLLAQDALFDADRVSRLTRAGAAR
jgi:predicted NBD/HSP70 family sugar kinase